MSIPKKRTLESECTFTQLKAAFFEELSKQPLHVLEGVGDDLKACMDSFHRRKFENEIRKQLKENNFSLSFVISKLPNLSPEQEEEEKDVYEIQEIDIATKLRGSGQGRKCYLDESSVQIEDLDDECHLLIHTQYLNDSHSYPDFQNEIAGEHLTTDSLKFNGEDYSGTGSLPVYIHYTKIHTLDQAIQLSKEHPEETYYYLGIDIDQGISVIRFLNGEYIKDSSENQQWSTPNPLDFEDTTLVPTNENAVET